MVRFEVVEIDIGNGQWRFAVVKHEQLAIFDTREAAQNVADGLNALEPKC